ncbi:MAG TPA: asparagine synthase-related protein [Candidatus Acidoferrum sp.]|nr:asparagine synthase-related protein [Candidatus Acidoferrum sp.]
MSVGFFVAASRFGLSRERVNSAFVAHTMWDQDGGNKEIDIQERNWCVVCMKDSHSGASSCWKEKVGDGPGVQGSFVYLLGWCYRISTFSESLSADDYRRMVERFRANEPPLSDDFGGQFVALVYDAKRKRIAVQPDRLALSATYFAAAESEFAASNRALRLANYFGSALDGHSVLAQMRGTHMPFGRTLFAGVRRLMGAMYVEFDLAQGVAQIRKPHSLFVPARKISYADSVDMVADTLRTTVRRLLAASPVRFDLTGGNDTRVIASAVENITRDTGNRNFAFRVADPEGSPDVSVARRVAECHGWPLFRVDRNLPVQATSQELARAATTGDGNFPVPVIWERVISERAYAAQNPAKTHAGAAAGELFRGFFYAQEMLSLGRRKNMHYDRLLAYRTYASRGVDLRILGPGAPTFEAHDQALLAPYRVIGEEGGSLPNANKLDLMYLQRHCYRSGNTISWLSGFLYCRLPFLTWEMAGLGLSLPWKHRANRGLIQRVIGRLSPKLANIPTEDGEPMKPLSLATLPAYLAAEIPIGIDRARRALRQLIGRPAGWKGSVVSAPQPAYLSILDSAKSMNAIFDQAAIKQVRAAAGSQQDSRDSVMTFYVLCSIELLLREAPALRHRLVFD